MEFYFINGQLTFPLSFTAVMNKNAFEPYFASVTHYVNRILSILFSFGHLCTVYG
jgi:hypothetical protein